MAFPQGINFRATSGYVTDPANFTYEITNGGGTDYPTTTPQGNNIGWETVGGGGIDARDRTTGNIAQLAGMNRINTAANVSTYRVDLPSAGTYTFNSGHGDASYAVPTNFEVYDTTTQLTSLAGTATTAANKFRDAANNEWANTAWAANNVGVNRTFATTICRFKNPAGTQTNIASILITAVTTGIAFDAASNSGYQAAASSYSWSHTCTGADRYLTVGISMLSLAQTVTSITYNSVPMIFLGAQNSVTGAARVELWGLANPSTGSNTIAVTLSGAIASAGNASSYTGVEQTAPIEGFNSAQATNVGAADATVNVTTVADNDWCVDIVATDDTAITVGAGQTQAGNVTGAGGSGAMSYEGPKTPAGSVTMSWTNVAALATWSIASVALRPATGGGLSQKFFLVF